MSEKVEVTVCPVRAAYGYGMSPDMEYLRDLYIEFRPPRRESIEFNRNKKD
jgi:hypothetical protein